jgi:uncharacterized membrane protein
MWSLIVGSIAFALFLSLIEVLVPKWFAWTLALAFAYVLICWT